MSNKKTTEPLTRSLFPWPFRYLSHDSIQDLKPFEILSIYCFIHTVSKLTRAQVTAQPASQVSIDLGSAYLSKPVKQIHRIPFKIGNSYKYERIRSKLFKNFAGPPHSFLQYVLSLHDSIKTNVLLRWRQHTR